MTEDATPRARRTHQLFWRFYAAVYDRLWDHELTDEVAAAVGQLAPRDQPVMEIGAGTGLVTERLRDLGFTVTAVEPEPAMARRLRRRVPEVPVSSGTLVECAAADPTTAAGTNGPLTVVAAHVLHFLADPADASRRLRELAGPGGTVIVVTPRGDRGLLGTAAALRAAGGRVGRATTFVLWHLALAPLASAAGCVARPERLDAVRELEGEPSAELSISDVFVLDGTGAMADSSGDPSASFVPAGTSN